MSSVSISSPPTFLGPNGNVTASFVGQPRHGKPLPVTKVTVSYLDCPHYHPAIPLTGTGVMPESEVHTLVDPYEHQQLLRNADVRLVVTSPGDYRAELTRINLDRLWIQRSHDALPRLFHTA